MGTANTAAVGTANLFLGSLLLVAAGAACSSGWAGRIDAQGAWSDGEAIFFSNGALVTEASEGSFDIRAVRQSVDRFMGMRISLNTKVVTTPGTYSVDSAPAGDLELYCIYPAPGYEASAIKPPGLAIEAEVNAANITFEVLPTETEPVVRGSFSDVRLEREGVRLLTLERGMFEAELR